MSRELRDAATKAAAQAAIRRDGVGSAWGRAQEASGVLAALELLPSARVRTTGLSMVTPAALAALPWVRLRAGACRRTLRCPHSHRRSGNAHLTLPLTPRTLSSYACIGPLSLPLRQRCSPDPAPPTLPAPSQMRESPRSSPGSCPH